MRLMFRFRSGRRILATAAPSARSKNTISCYGGPAWVWVVKFHFEEAIRRWACLSSQVTNQSWVQGLFQDVWPVKGGHIECGRRGTWVIRGGVPLTGDGWWGHSQRRGTLLVVLTVTLFIQWQGETLPFLSSVAKPNTYNLWRTALVVKNSKN